MNRRALSETAARWLAEERPAVLVQVSEARGSVPRDAGTRMLVGREETAGTIGGGHLEFQAIAQARELLDRGDPGPRSLHFSLGPSLGQCCGGAVTLGLERLTPAHLAGWPAPQPLFHLQLHGAGHVGRAIARLLAGLDVRVDWIDEREAWPAPDAGAADWPAHIRPLVMEAAEAEVAEAKAGAFFLVLTHRHDLDERITEAILRRGDFGFLGLIGSATKRQRFVRRFEQRGIAPASIARLVCPIGLPGIEGKEPEVIAVATVAQLLQVAGGCRAPHAG